MSALPSDCLSLLLLKNLSIELHGMRIGHLPTWLLIIGYPIFWLEMYLRPGAHSSALAPALFLLVAVHVGWKDKGVIPLLKSHARRTIPDHLNILLILVILTIACVASLLPPHLIQEIDALNYHLTMPRQHLISGTFEHMPWAIADLWPLPLQFSLAPFWFSTPWPNKFPQFIFLVGLLLVSLSMLRKVAPQKNPPSLLLLSAIVGSHGLAVQFGLAMLDISIAYLALACLDSLLNKNWIIGSVEFTFLFWSKAFMPIQITLLLLGFLALEMTRRFMDGRWMLGFQEHRPLPSIPWRRVLLVWAILSLFIGGPFIAKSMREVGTPLFPFATFHWNGKLSESPVTKQAVLESARSHHQTRDDYGEGRSLKAFLSHFWALAVPKQGVNNRFDYPLGLPYLLCLGPFVFLFLRSLKQRELSFFAWIVVFWWATWWMGSQQSRWFYVSLLLMLILTLSERLFSDRFLMRWGLSLALLMTSVSVYRTHGDDVLRLPTLPIRAVDRQLKETTEKLPQGARLRVDRKEAAYAESMVRVVDRDTMWILPELPIYDGPSS